MHAYADLDAASHPMVSRSPAAPRRTEPSALAQALAFRATPADARGGAVGDDLVEDQRDAGPAWSPAPAPGVTPPPPPPPAPPAPAAGPVPVAVRNGPAHAPIDEPSRVGMSIAITLTSSTGVDADMAAIEDSEQVGLSYNHTGSFVGMPPLPSNQSGWMPGHPIPDDQHSAPRALIVDRADNHGGDGSFEKDQLDIWRVPGATPGPPAAIPKSGYIIKRTITTGPATRIAFRTEKRAAAVTVGSYSTTAGPSATQGETVVVRA